ncbi:MAG TPA: 50S ribosomal protein L13 [Candidatus Pacearchaeota archaeon]|nr:50S ribosomal protein L13 [Candidatus Pacearchaeota archaeon]
METYTLDAKDKALGRLATEIVSLLRGKNKPDFMPNKDSGNVVIIKNISEVKLTGNKLLTTTYFKHTGYIGSEEFIPMKRVFEKDGGKELLRLAVYRMLPKNKMRDQQIKRLKFEK